MMPFGGSSKEEGGVQHRSQNLSFTSPPPPPASAVAGSPLSSSFSFSLVFPHQEKPQSVPLSLGALNHIRGPPFASSPSGLGGALVTSSESQPSQPVMAQGHMPHVHLQTADVARPPQVLAVSTGAIPRSQYQAPFTANPTIFMPPGVLGSAPAGMSPRFPGVPFIPMLRPPTFPPRAPNLLVRAPLIRPNAIVRPSIPEKPQTLVYVGKIAPSVDDEFLKPILELCGSIKSWKRAQEPTAASFGFCEFVSADGVLRALRLLNGLSLDGRELKLTVTQAAREYLDRYVQTKKETEKQLKQEANTEREAEAAPGVDVLDPVKDPVSETPQEDQSTEEDQVSDEKTFGLVNNEDREADEYAQKKLAALLEERRKLMPLPPPPPMTCVSDAIGNSASMSDMPAKSRDEDSVADGGKNDGPDGANEETSENKGNSELDGLDLNPSDRGKRTDKHGDRESTRERDGGRDRDRDKNKEKGRNREKDWEIDQMERERERIHARRERDREMRLRDSERLYEDSEKAWEEREKEKERIRNVDREKEKEREKQRARLITEQEEENHDNEGWGERKRIQREWEDDEKDRLREQEEIVEAKRKRLKEDYEEQVKKRLSEMAEAEAEAATKAADIAEEGSIEPEATYNAELTQPESKQGSHVSSVGGTEKDTTISNMITDEDVGRFPVSIMDMGEKPNTGPKKLGFGLMGAGRRATMPSVFYQDDEEDVPKGRGLRQLVPIEYSAEEMQAVTSLKPATIGTIQPSLAAAAEFAKSLSNLQTSTSKEEVELDLGRGRRQNEKSNNKDQREENGKKCNRKKEQAPARLDAKHLIDTIPKTKDELFAYEVDWKIYSQHEIHERMNPWIQKKIAEYLGEEENTLVEYIVSNLRKHASATTMLELLTKILDDEAEMFVMKMWRMLIFEIKKVEIGLSPKTKV